MSFPDPGPSPVSSWKNMTEWLQDSVEALAPGAILDVGPAGVVIYSGAEDMICAQVRKLEDDVLWLRVSDAMLGVPHVVDLSVNGLVLDTWLDDELFDDCTEAQLFSRDSSMIAEACVSWFQVRRGFSDSSDLGFEHIQVETLPRVVETCGGPIKQAEVDLLSGVLSGARSDFDDDPRGPTAYGSGWRPTAAM